MATYNNSRFYWLQLKEDFFDEDAIDWLEEQPNGKEYSLFYLKLCLKSLRTNGVLIRRVGNLLVPYDHTKLGELTKTNPDTVLVAMELLLKIGLVQKLENGELYITQVENMIGSQSIGAFKKQQQRISKSKLLLENTKGGQGVDKCPPDIDKDIDKDKDLNIEKKKEKESKSKYGTFDNVLLTLTEYQKLQNEFSNYQEAIDHLSEYIERTGYKVKSHYLALRKWVFNALKEEELKARELEQREKRAAEIGKQQSLKELKDFYGSANFDQREYTADELNGMYSNLDDIVV